MNDLEAFNEMKCLLGDWEVAHDHGRVSSVNYRMSCHNSVMVECWALKPDMESLTLFHMDNGKLIATHYCPLGNQPRLEYVGMQNDKHIFKTASVTNLAKRGDEHCTAVDFQFVSPDKVIRQETYTANGVAAVESGEFTRRSQGRILETD